MDYTFKSVQNFWHVSGWAIHNPQDHLTMDKTAYCLKEAHNTIYFSSIVFCAADLFRGFLKVSVFPQNYLIKRSIVEQVLEAHKQIFVCFRS